MAPALALLTFIFSWTLAGKSAGTGLAVALAALAAFCPGVRVSSSLQ